MQLDDAQAAVLKPWVVKKLEDISDADSDVLADYVLALVRADDDPAKVRANSIDNLKDFLFDSTAKFVDEVVKAVQTRSYDPDAPRISAAAQNASRKRTFDDHADADAPLSRFPDRGDRPVKQARRGGRGGRAARAQQDVPQWQNGEGMPTMSPQDAMNMMMAMHQAMGLPPLPGMQSFSRPQRRGRARCRDYDTKGFCTRGAACRYEHGADAVTVSEQVAPQQNFSSSGGGHGRAAGKGGPRRAEFSMTGPSTDHSMTAIVVESIPENNLNNEDIRGAFSEFGTIVDIDLQAQKRLAIITYGSWAEANAAWKSPKVLFDNRFVKVFWYNPHVGEDDSLPRAGETDANMGDVEADIDHEEIALRQEEAQRRYEANKKLRAEAQRQRFDIDAKLKAVEDERKKYADLLAKKTGTSAPATSTDTDESEQTRGLKEQLAKLEAEALSLGIDPTAATANGLSGHSTSDHSWRGRGGFRGRARYSTRAAYRGSWNAGGRGGAVRRLDNRPRALTVAFPNGTYDKYDEAMRQYLLFSDNLEHATLAQHPDRPDAALVVFEERYRAENFMAAAKGPSGIPNIGAVEISWAPNSINGAVGSKSQPSNGDTSNESTMQDIEATTITTDADYDVAEG